TDERNGLPHRERHRKPAVHRRGDMRQPGWRLRKSHPERRLAGEKAHDRPWHPDQSSGATSALDGEKLPAESVTTVARVYRRRAREGGISGDTAKRLYRPTAQTWRPWYSGVGFAKHAQIHRF